MFTEVGVIPKRCYIGNMVMDGKEFKFYPDRIILRTSNDIIEMNMVRDVATIFVSSVEKAKDMDAIGYHVYILCRGKNISGFNPPVNGHHLFDPSSDDRSIKYISALFSVSLSTCLWKLYPCHHHMISPDSAVEWFCTIVSSAAKKFIKDIINPVPIEVILIGDDEEAARRGGGNVKDKEQEECVRNRGNKRKRIDSGSSSAASSSPANSSAARKKSQLPIVSEILDANYILFDHIECRYEKIHFCAQRVSFKITQVEGRDCKMSVFLDKKDIEWMTLCEKYSVISFGLKEGSNAGTNLSRKLRAALYTWYPFNKFFSVKLQRIRVRVVAMVRPCIQVDELDGEKKKVSVLQAMTTIAHKRANQGLEQSTIVQGLVNLQFLPPF